MKKALVLVFVPLLCLMSGCVEVSKVMTLANNQTMAVNLSQTESRINDPMVERYFAELGSMVLASARRLDKVDDPGFKPDPLMDIYDRFEVHTVHDFLPNAFVAGDDFTVINSALIVTAESPEELVMILGHEFGHLRNGHLVEKMGRLQAGLVAGEIARAVAKSEAKGTRDERKRAGSEAAAMMTALFLPQTPSNEFESDDTGIEIMVDLGLDLQYADDFFERMLKKYGDGGGGSHPRPSARIARVRAHMDDYARRGYQPTRTLDRAEFLVMRDRVRTLLRQGIEKDSIVFFSKERGAAALRGEQLVQPMCCGPLYADTDVVVAEFLKSIGMTGR